MAEYVSNKELLAELIEYKNNCRIAAALGSEKPQINNKIASAITRICTNLSNRDNFIGYSFKDDMIGDAILKCFIKLEKFNEERGENPFAYFSQIAWNCYINRISKEKAEISAKAKLIRNTLTSDFVEQGIGDSDMGNQFVEFLLENDAYVDYIEQSKLNKVNGTGYLHDSLRHRNKTPYVKTVEEPKQVKPIEPEVDLWNLE
jgi:hypothetical protein